MNELYQALEICLSQIEDGADMQTVLRGYPELADDLQPLLEASLRARELAVPAPSQEIIARNRARVLQHAAEMRERKITPINRMWSAPLRWALVTLVVASLLFISGTNLVRAASNTLPGDSLYSVKRAWENVMLFLTFDVDKREALELDHENERLEELHELYDIGRSAQVEFSGYVTRQIGDEWRVSGITVFISTQTRLPEQQIQVGAAVQVKGQTKDNGVAATLIESLPAGSKLPEVEDLDPGTEEENHGGPDQQIEDGQDTGSGPEAPGVVPTSTLVPGNEVEVVSIEGIVTAAQNVFVVVNGIVIDTRNAELTGIARVGAFIRVEGYYDASGIFIAINVQIIDGSSGSGGNTSGNQNNNNKNTNSNGDQDNDDSYQNDNDNSNNDNSNNSNHDDDNKNENGNGN